MRINENNISLLPSNIEKDVIKALLKDLDSFNKMSPKTLYIDWQDYHNEYSAERTDPCPDYYGAYKLIDEKTNDSISIEMNINELDATLCVLCNLYDI